MAEAKAVEVQALLETARRLRARAKGASASLPPLLFLTDPRRTPDPARVAAGLPRGCGLVFRAFGAADARFVGRRLREIADARGLVLLVGADEALAQAIGADGVHLPERTIHRAGPIHRRHPGWIVTAAAHGRAAVVAAARAGADAVLLSPAFESASASAGRPLGPTRFAALARAAPVPVYALGGVNMKTAPRLLGSGAAGLAAIGGLIRT
jgi:thiamine-phosphate pyrophosphorylase